MGMIKVEVYLDDGSSEELTLATNKAVCGRCQGEGTQDVWEGGMTGDEMAEQGPEFFEDYMSGVYSKPCEVCHGQRVVDEVDRKHNTASALAKYDAHMQEQAEYQAMVDAERRMGA